MKVIQIDQRNSAGDVYFKCTKLTLWDQRFR